MSALAPAPITIPGPLRATAGTRAIAAILASLALTVLILGAVITPDPSGMGSHRQLGLPPCGWLLAPGYPCPTCGMTTAFAFATHLQPARALYAQPFGAALALATAIFFWGALHVAIFGSQLARVFERLLAPRIMWFAGAALLAAWAYKVWQVRAGQ